MSIKALLIDGVGHVEEMTLASALPRVKIPKPADPAVRKGSRKRTEAPGNHEFNRLGALSDGRMVYGQDVASLEIWAHDVNVTVETDDRSAIDMADRELAMWLECNTSEPCRRLIHTTSRDDTRGLVTYHFEGVARRRD